MSQPPPSTPPWSAFFPLTTVMLVIVLAVFRYDALEEAALDLKKMLHTTSDTVLYASMAGAFVLLAAVVQLGIAAYQHLAALSKRAQTERAALAKERLALQVIYETLGGAKWKKSCNWMTDAPLHEWYGITIDHASKHITKLILQENNLAGPLPPAIAHLTWLNELDLRDNQLCGPIPADLSTLRGLQGLYLYGNRLSGRVPDELVRLAPTLQGIYLLNNELEDLAHTKALMTGRLHPDCVVII